MLIHGPAVVSIGEKTTDAPTGVVDDAVAGLVPLTLLARPSVPVLARALETAAGDRSANC